MSPPTIDSRTFPGSARVSRAGFGVSPKQSFPVVANVMKVCDCEDALASTRDACTARKHVRIDRWLTHNSKLHGMVLQCAPGHLDIVKRHGAIREFLISFVAFAGDQNDVARLRERDSAGDCLSTVNDFFVMT